MALIVATWSSSRVDGDDRFTINDEPGTDDRADAVKLEQISITRGYA